MIRTSSAGVPTQPSNPRRRRMQTSLRTTASSTTKYEHYHINGHRLVGCRPENNVLVLGFPQIYQDADRYRVEPMIYFDTDKKRHICYRYTEPEKLFEKTLYDRNPPPPKSSVAYLLPITVKETEQGQSSIHSKYVRVIRDGDRERSQSLRTLDPSLFSALNPRSEKSYKTGNLLMLSEEESLFMRTDINDRTYKCHSGRGAVQLLYHGNQLSSSTNMRPLFKERSGDPLTEIDALKYALHDAAGSSGVSNQFYAQVSPQPILATSPDYALPSASDDNRRKLESTIREVILRYQFKQHQQTSKRENLQSQCISIKMECGGDDVFFEFHPPPSKTYIIHVDPQVLHGSGGQQNNHHSQKRGSFRLAIQNLINVVNQCIELRYASHMPFLIYVNESIVSDRDINEYIHSRLAEKEKRNRLRDSSKGGVITTTTIQRNANRLSVDGNYIQQNHPIGREYGEKKSELSPAITVEKLRKKLGMDTLRDGSDDPVDDQQHSEENDSLQPIEEEDEEEEEFSDEVEKEEDVIGESTKKLDSSQLSAEEYNERARNELLSKSPHFKGNLKYISLPGMDGRRLYYIPEGPGYFMTPVYNSKNRKQNGKPYPKVKLRPQKPEKEVILIGPTQSIGHQMTLLSSRRDRPISQFRPPAFNLPEDMYVSMKKIGNMTRIVFGCKCNLPPAKDWPFMTDFDALYVGSQ